jgi:hypothetical protein
MVLHGDVGVWIELGHTDGELVREHQEPDIVEEGREFQIVQLTCRQADRSSDQQRNCSSAAAMTGLPWERPIDFPADLAHENAFDVTARRGREMEAIDFSEHSLDRDDPWVNVFRDMRMHRNFS